MFLFQARKSNLLRNKHIFRADRARGKIIELGIVFAVKQKWQGMRLG